MPDRNDPSRPVVVLPVDLDGEEREEAEQIVRDTRRALAEAFDRVDVDTVPHVPTYARRPDSECLT